MEEWKDHTDWEKRLDFELAVGSSSPRTQFSIYRMGPWDLVRAFQSSLWKDIWGLYRRVRQRQEVGKESNSVPKESVFSTVLSYRTMEDNG